MRSNRRYTDVTGEKLRRMYPTKDWAHRYRKAVYGGRGR